MHRQPPDAVVFDYRFLPEFTHLAEHRPVAFAPAGHHRQRLQSSPHRVGFVVGIVDDGHAVGAGMHLHPAPRRRLGTAKRGAHLLQRSAALEGDSGRTQRAADLTLAVHGH